MKDSLHKLIDSMTDSEIIYSYTFLMKMFGKGDAA